MKRKQTSDIVVLVSGTSPDATPFEIATKYRAQGALNIGSHYLIDRDGDVQKTRPHEDIGNVHEDFDESAIYIEIVGTSGSYIRNEAQQAAAAGLVEYLQEQYLNAYELDWTI